MGSYNRYYPVSHALNRDPEFIQLRQIFGDWMGFVWHEMLAWGDRTGGELKGNPTQIAYALGPNSLQKYLKPAVNRIQIAFKFMSDCGWIRVETDRIVILNYAKWHRNRDSILHRDEGESVALLPSFLPNLPSSSLGKEEEKSIVLSHAKTARASIIPVHGEWPSVDALVALYNEKAPDECPSVTKVSNGRVKKARQYLTQFPDREFWEKVMRQITHSSLLRGLKKGANNGHGSWVADFDWLLSLGKEGTENAVKVHDGKYLEG